MIRKVVIENFRCFRKLEVDLDPALTILVGNNDAGKSTLLEAIHVALTGRYGRQHVLAEVTQYHINQESSDAYLAAIRRGDKATPPSVLIELYLKEADEFQEFRGTNNSLRENTCGIRLLLELDPLFEPEYRMLLAEARHTLRAVPIEYYRAEWTGFDGNSLFGRRSVQINPSLVDAAKIRLKSGSDYYLQQIIEESLDPLDRIRMAGAYRSLREQFAQDPGVAKINDALTARQEEITDRKLTMAVDVGGRTAWETGLVPHLNDLPVQYTGHGEQSMLKILLALSRQRVHANVILVEEPENHLSFSNLNRLIAKIVEHDQGQQVIVTTHSSFVLNKLGLDRLVLLNRGAAMKVVDLSDDTLHYFKKLPGHDTLRMVLAHKVILVEGPSDDLIVQRAYFDQHGKGPLDDGVDVIAVGSLAFGRFLEIARCLKTPTTVVTDNDGDPARVEKKYAAYAAYPNIRICYSKNPALRTLEYHLAEHNDLSTMNRILKTKCSTKEDLRGYMVRRDNKTECALRIFESSEAITMPDYIGEAVK